MVFLLHRMRAVDDGYRFEQNGQTVGLLLIETGFS